MLDAEWQKAQNHICSKQGSNATENLLKKKKEKKKKKLAEVIYFCSTIKV
jgi:hypothetical protein